MANNGFAGKLFTEAGFHYRSFDLAASPFNRRFDLNIDIVGEEDVGRYDLVTNFGTTEHVMDQMRAFRTIHDLAKVGGIIFHAMPINLNFPLCGCATH